MKQFYTSVAALILASGVSVAQVSKVTKVKKESYSATSQASFKAAAPAAMATIWQDDFSTPANWTIANTSIPSADWSIGTAAPSGAGGFPIAAIASTTASNGFALFDSDGLGSGSSVHNATITTANPINLSAYPAVSLQFESFYRKFQGMCFVGFSTDNGTTWTEIELYAALAVNASIANPTSESIVLTGAGGNSAVLIRFRYEGGWDYAWMVDDIELIETPANLMSINGGNYDAVWTGNELEYSMYPEAQIGANPHTIEVAVSNIGSGNQTNVRVICDLIKNSSVVLSDTSALGHTVPSGTNDTITIVDMYTAGGIGTFTVNITAKSDSIPAPTPITKSFSITDSVYARDQNTAAGAYMISTNCGGYELGNAFDLYSTEIASSVSCYLSPQYTKPGGVIYGRIYGSDLATVVAETDYLLVTSAHVGAWITLPLQTATSLIMDSTYFVVIGSEQSNNDSIGLAASGGSPVQTCFLLDKDNCEGNGAGTWYYVTSTPMVRLNFSQCASFASVIINSTDDSGAANGTATATPNGGSAPFSYLWSNGQTTQTVTGLSCAAAGTYTVTVTDANSCSKAGATTIYCVGINQVSEIPAVKVYPNPTSSVLNIAFENNFDTYTVIISNTLGEVVSEERFSVNGATTRSFNFTGLAKGVYYTTITNASGKRNVDMIVVK